MSRAALEVPGARTDQRLALSDHALAGAPADGAVRVHDDGSGIHENIQEAFLRGLLIDGAAGRHYQEAHAGSDLSPFDQLRADPELFDPPVVAGAEESFIDMDPRALPRVDHVVHEMGLRDHRSDTGKIYFVLLRVHRAFIRREHMLRGSSVLFQIVDGEVVHLAETGLRSRFHAEVAETHAVGHAEGVESFSAELHRLVVGAVGADAADDGQDQVSGGDAFRQFSGQVEAERLRDKDPGGACHHGVEVICAADARAECAQGAVGAGVAVRAEDQLARGDVLLHHHLMAHALTLIEGDAVLLREIAHLLLGRCRLHGITGNVVVHDPHKL